MENNIIGLTKIDLDLIRNKRVFIALPTYSKDEYPKFLQLLDGLQDLNVDYEINVCKDCDTDGQFINDVCKSIDHFWLDDFVKFHTSKERSNIALARQKLLQIFKERADEFDYFLSLDDDTYVPEGTVEKAVYILENSQYDYISGDWAQQTEENLEKYGEYNDYKIRPADDIKFGGMFSLYSKRAIMESGAFYHPEVCPREDMFFTACMKEKGFDGCRTKLDYVHERHERGVNESFARGSKDWQNSNRIIKESFSDLISHYDDFGTVHMKNKKFNDECNLVYDDRDMMMKVIDFKSKQNG